MEKAERAEKAVALAVAVLLAVVTEMETLKEKFRVDVSVNNWKIDLLLQPLSVKSHTYVLSRKCGNYSILQNYVFRNITWRGRSFLSLNLVLQCRNMIDVGFAHVFKFSLRNEYVVQKIILANCCRLIKAVMSKVIIDDWKQRKRINDALPEEERRTDVENSIEELQLPMFQSAAIGCLHEATEAFLVSTCAFIPVF